MNPNTVVGLEPLLGTRIDRWIDQYQNALDARAHATTKLAFAERDLDMAGIQRWDIARDAQKSRLRRLEKKRVALVREANQLEMRANREGET